MKKVIFPLLIISLLLLLLQVVAFAKSTEYIGYLSDVMCASKGIAGDGANLQKSPKKHTVACMKIPDCAASGYGVLIKDKKAGKYIFYKFDEKGNEIAKKLLETTKKTDNIKIKVKGTMMKDLIMIESIVEK
jgi:hypothetical protein